MTTRLALLLCLLGLAGAARAQEPPAPVTVVVVRHAERASDEGDSPLSPAGERRAAALAAALREAGVRAIYTTQYLRTRQTAQPLADALGLAPVAQAWTDPPAQAAALAAELRARHAGETVLVVGHSNTVPLILRALGGAALPDLGAAEYDRLFVVRVPRDGPARTIQARY